MNKLEEIKNKLINLKQRDYWINYAYILIFKKNNNLDKIKNDCCNISCLLYFQKMTDIDNYINNYLITHLDELDNINIDILYNIFSCDEKLI